VIRKMVVGYSRIHIDDIMKKSALPLILIGVSLTLLPHVGMLIAIDVFGRDAENWMLPGVCLCLTTDFIGIAFLIWGLIRLFLSWRSGKLN
jgi:hypothetical protein